MEAARVERLARELLPRHRRVGQAYLALGVPLLLLGGLARSRLHDLLWSAAIYDTSFALLVYGAGGALLLGPWLARARPGRYLRLCAASGAVAALLLLAELGIRLLRPGEVRLQATATTTILTQANQRLQPNRTGEAGGVPLRSNDLGLRGPSVEPTPPPQTTRILALGDSYTFGSGVEEPATWPFRVAALLGERFPGRRFDVVNAGHDGFSARDELRELEHFLPVVRPDIILVGACQNDHWIVSAPLDAARRWRYSFVENSVAAGAMRHSALCALIGLAYDKLLLSTGLRDTQGAVHASMAEAGSADWEAFLEAHRGMQRAARAAGKPAPLVQVLANVSRAGPAPGGGAMHARYLEGLAGIGVPVHTALPELAGLEGRYLVLNDWDSHPNALGHDAYARAFVRELLARGYLDGQGAPAPAGR